MIWRNIFSEREFFHFSTVWPSTHFRKISVKLTLFILYTKYEVWCYFHEIFFNLKQISRFSTLCELLNEHHKNVILANLQYTSFLFLNMAVFMRLLNLHPLKRSEITKKYMMWMWYVLEARPPFLDKGSEGHSCLQK